jgi:Ig-like domain CHU_C associated
MRRRLAAVMAVVCLCLITPAAFAESKYIRHPNAVPQEYIVGFGEEVALADARVLAARLGAEYGVEVLYVFDSGFAGFHARGPGENIRRLSLRRDVAWVEENARLALSAGRTTTEGSAGTNPANGGWTLARIARRHNAEQQEPPANEYRYETGGEDVFAYVIDSGVFAAHNEFSGGRVQGGADLLGENQHHAPCPGDAPCMNDPLCVNGGHGTAVASVMGGKNFGVAPGVTIVPVRITDCSATNTDIVLVARALTWVAGDLATRRRGAGFKGAVVNISSENPVDLTDSRRDLPTLRAALRAVVNQGGVVFAAAGNNPPGEHRPANNGDACNNFPAGFSYGNGQPGPHVISASGVDTNGERCDTAACSGGTRFSFGPCVDVFVPASQVKAAHFRKLAGNTVLYGSNALDALRPKPSSDGTSFAAPQAAGAAARLLAELSLFHHGAPWRTSDIVWNALRASATPNAITSGPSLFGAPNRLLYAGGTPVLNQPQIKEGSNGQVTLEIAADPKRPHLTYEWRRGSYATSTVVTEDSDQNPRTITVTRPASLEDTYWVRVRETVGGIALTGDSALVRVTACSNATIPAIRIENTADPNRRRLSVTPLLTGDTFEWYRGLAGDTTDRLSATGNSVDVPVDVITPYWVRIKSSGCTIDSKTVMLEGCNIFGPIVIGRPTEQGIEEIAAADGDETVRIPIWAGVFDDASGGKEIALTVRSPLNTLFTSIEWHDGGTVQYGRTYRTTISFNTRDVTIVLRNGTCQDVRKIRLEALVTPGCRQSLIQTNPVLPAAKSQTERVPLDLGYSSRAIRVEWRKGESDDTSAPVFTCNATGTAAGVCTFANAIPGQAYWARVIGKCGGGTYFQDSPVFRLACTDCQRRHSTGRSVPKCNKERTTGCQQPEEGAEMELEAPDDEIAGAVYEWREGADRNPSTAVLATTYSTRRSVPGKYWVRTKLPDLTFTDSFTVEIIPPVSTTEPAVTVRVTPSTRFISVDGTAVIEVDQVTGFCDNAAVTFEWFENEVSGTGKPGSRYTLVTPPDTTIVYLRATERWYTTRNGVTSCHPHSVVVPVTITVICDPVSNVGVITTPLDRHIGKDELIALGAVGVGKKLLYTWHQGQSTDPNPPLVAHGPGLLRQPATDASYFVHAEDACGNVDTEDVKLFVCKPAVAPLPELVTVIAGESKTITAGATAPQTGQALTYQWYSGDMITGGAPIAGATSPALTVSQAGRYWVVVKGTCADGYRPIVNSTAMQVVICTRPTISAVTSRDIAPGQTAVISVTAAGSNLSYQWYRGASGNTSQPIAGATSAALSDAPAATSQYWCRVTSDNSCWTDSGTTSINVCSYPAITTQPQTVKIRRDQTASLSVAATGATSYQWYRAADNSAVTGATAASFTTPALTQDTSYYVKAIKGECATTSQTVTVYVCTLSVAASTNKTQVVSGESAQISAAVTFQRSQELYYTWYSGASADTATTLVTQGPAIAAILQSPPSTTWYRVKVSDGTCETTSSAVKVEYCVQPAVNVQPVSQLLDKTQNAYATAQLSAGATGGSVVTWQWYTSPRGNTSAPVAGATSAAITVSPTQTTTYWARATGTCGYTADSQTATITICQPPAITAQPTIATVTANTQTTMAVSATGTNLHYAWYKGPAESPTAVAGDSPSISVSVPSTTRFWVVVSGACGNSVTSAAGILSVRPVINTPPAAQRVTKGTAATFSVAASGTYLTYQWYYSPSTPISGATAATFTTPALTSDVSVWVRVRSENAYVDTTPVTATVCQPKAISVSQPSNVSGSNVTLSVVSPDGNETYTWYRGTSGDTSVSLGTGTSKLVAPDATTGYWFRSSGYGCTADSSTVTVTVCVPRISTQPSGTMINPGGTHRLSVSAVGTAPLSYQWYAGGSPISGATQSYYDASPGTDTSYTVRVASGAGASCYVDSASTTVQVCKLPSITAQPASVNTSQGASVSLSVGAAGTDLTYQWYERTAAGTNVAVTGATSSTSTITANGTRNYWVRVTGRCGAVDSSLMKVSVPPTLPAGFTVYVRSGTSATFTLNATGNERSYQWYQGSTPQPNGTGDTFTTPPLTADTSYWVRVYSGNAYADGGYYQAKVCNARGISVYQPSNVSGASVTLSAATTAADETYSWYDAAGTLLSNGTQITMYPAGTTTYTLRTTRGSCYADSTVTVTVCVPRITTQPAGSMINAGQTATVSVAAQGSAPLSYQWYSGSTPISGATGATYSWVPQNDTSLRVRVSSPQGGGCYVDSDTVLVRVCKAPAITQQPSSAVIYSTDTVTLSVAASGTDLTYQWYESTTGANVLLNGATSSSFTIQPGSTRIFWVLISGRCGQVGSNAVTLSVRPAITAHPANTAVCAGATATFSVSASGSGLSYRWFEGASGTTGTVLGTSRTLSIAVPAQKTVWCEVRSGAAVTNSQAATASVTPGPQTFVGKQYAGWSYNWILSASVSEELAGVVTYNWYRGSLGDTSTLAGQSNSLMVYAETQTWYWVRVTNTQTGCWTDTGVSAGF